MAPVSRRVHVSWTHWRLTEKHGSHLHTVLATNLLKEQYSAVAGYSQESFLLRFS